MTGVLAGHVVRYFNFSLRGAFSGVGVLDQNQKTAGKKFFIKRVNWHCTPYTPPRMNPADNTHTHTHRPIAKNVIFRFRRTQNV